MRCWAFGLFFYCLRLQVRTKHSVDEPRPEQQPFKEHPKGERVERGAVSDTLAIVIVASTLRLLKNLLVEQSGCNRLGFHLSLCFPSGNVQHELQR